MPQRCVALYRVSYDFCTEPLAAKRSDFLASKPKKSSQKGVFEMNAKNAAHLVRAHFSSWTILLAAAFCAPAIALPADAPAAKSEIREFIVVEGSVAFASASALPPHALLSVRVEDVSRADAPAQLIGEFKQPLGAQRSPIPFVIKVPAQLIDARHSYSVRATMHWDGKLQFTSTRHNPVLTRGAGNTVEVQMEAIKPTTKQQSEKTTAQAAPATAPLQGTFWKLIQIAGKAMPGHEGQALGMHKTRDIGILLDKQGLRLSGFSGCNRLMGAYQVNQQALTFTELGGTRMACPAASMALEQQVLQLLRGTQAFRIDGQVLVLTDGTNELGRFNAVQRH